MRQPWLLRRPSIARVQDSPPYQLLSLVVSPGSRWMTVDGHSPLTGRKLHQSELKRLLQQRRHDSCVTVKATRFGSKVYVMTCL